MPFRFLRKKKGRGDPERWRDYLLDYLHIDENKPVEWGKSGNKEKKVATSRSKSWRNRKE